MMPELDTHPLHKKRIAIVSPSLASYRVPVFNRLSRIPGLDLCLIFADARERYRAWDTSLAGINFNYSLLDTVNVPLNTARADRTALSLTPKLWQILKRENYDLVVTLGWTMPNSFIVWLHGKLSARPAVLWEESIPHPPHGTKRLIMPLLKKYVGSFDGYLAASHACIEYMVQMGAPRSRVALMPQITDNTFFSTNAAVHRARRDELKRELGIATRHVILFVGQFTQRKNVASLLDAFRDLAAARDDTSLLLVGEGPLRAELQARSDVYGLQDRVFLLPFVQQSVLPQYYAIADVFCLPSVYDTFGVVIAEAMACSLPIVATTTVGATSSIVENNGNGFIVPPSDVPALSDALGRILADDELRARMSAESARIIATWDVELVAHNFTNLVAQCLSDRPKPRSARRDAISQL